MLDTIEKLPLSVWVAESPSVFAYTLVLSLHAIGLATVLGINALIAFRLLGFGTGIPLGSLRSFYGTIYAGFAINLVSGVLLFMAAATNMGTMPAFWVKMALVLTGMTLALGLKARYLDDTAATASGVVPPAIRRLAWVSLTCWTFALIVGRLTGYPEIVARIFGYRI